MKRLNREGPLLRLLFIIICFGLGFNPDLTRAQSSKTSAITKKVTIAHAILVNSTPLYVAFEKGYFKPGLDVSLHGFSRGQVALDEVLKGKADLATVAETPFMHAVLKGNEASIIATISETTHSLSLIGRKDKGVACPKDLKGKKIGVTMGSGGEFFLDTLLILNGITKKEVKKVNIPAEKMLGPLLKGDLDAVVNWDPFSQELLKALGANGVAHYGAPNYNRYTWNLVARKSWIDKNQENVKKLIQALIQGENFIKTNPSAARKILARYAKREESEVDKIWGNTFFQITLHPSLLMSLEDQARWAIRNKVTEAKTIPNFLHYIYFDALAAVRPAVVTIAH